MVAAKAWIRRRWKPSGRVDARTTVAGVDQHHQQDGRDRSVVDPFRHGYGKLTALLGANITWSTLPAWIHKFAPVLQGNANESTLSFGGFPQAEMKAPIRSR